MNNTITTKKLNPQQKEAVEFRTGPLLIIAGAGTGKTTVVTERIKHLITSGVCKPAEILALTFTEKAASEMEERVDQALPYGYTQMWISTFHSFCDRILKAEAVHIGLNPGYRLLSDTDLTMIMRKNIFNFDLEYFRPLGNPTKFIAGLLQHFSRLKDEDVNPSQYSAWIDKKLQITNEKSEEEKLEIKKYQELARAYKKYEAIKIKEGVMDFADLITNTLLLFRTRKNILKKYQEQFKFLLVDEFQDTNIAQNELILLLVGKLKNITAVADDDQCLPPATQVSTPTGKKLIKDIRVGDLVLTAVGKGYLSTSTVTKVFTSKKTTIFLTFITTSGKKLTVTQNHKLFCMVPGKKIKSDKHFYVYLMWRSDMGWRIGMTDDLAQRIRLERSADKIIAVKYCTSLEEARFQETTLSLTYQIPTYPFKPRKGMRLTKKWLEKLFSEFNTEANAKKLAADLGINIEMHHYCLAGVFRGEKERIKILLSMCYRRHRTKWARNRLLLGPKVSHQVTLETSSKRVKSILEKNNVQFTKTAKGIKVKKQFQDLQNAGTFAQKLQELTNGVLEVNCNIGKKNHYSRSALVVPAGNILPGMYLPVLDKQELVYEQILERKEESQTSEVYDLEINNTHNFIADGFAVHNSIYKFRGAAVSNVLSFRKHFPNTALIVLSKNYRSTQTILDESYRLITHNNPDRLEVKEGINKKLESTREIKGKPVIFFHLDRVENEAEAVAKEIKKLIERARGETKNEHYSWKDIAILVRANNHAEPFVRAFIRNAIPFQFLGPGQLFRQPEIKELISYLQVISNFGDNIALFKVLSMEFFDVSPRDLVALFNFAKKYNISLFEACEAVVGMFTIESAQIPHISAETREKLTKFITMIHRHLKLLTKETAGQILFYFLQDSGMLKNILEYKFPMDEKIANNITKFFNKLKTYEAEHEDASVNTVLDWILLAMELGESPLASDSDWTDNDAVNILTVHSAKGLEFPVVFLVNLVSQRFPTIQRTEQIPIPEALIKEALPQGDFHEEEERRLFYVGMTRARNLLYFTAANFYGEGRREKKVSPFVYEALGDGVIPFDFEKEGSQLSLLDWQKQTAKFPAVQNIGHKVTFLSYSQIETFKLCPLHYKLRYILKVPTPPSAALSFGTSVHAALKDFYLLIKQKQTVSQRLLLELLHKNWIREGYSQKRYEQEMLKRGEAYLAAYFEKEYTQEVTPLLIEQPFTVPIITSNDYLKIGGKIDRVDDLGGGMIEIIDYKTGRMPSKRELDTNLQLSMYAIAATEIPELPFKKRPEQVKLSLYYFDLQEKVTIIRTKEQLELEKEKIMVIAREIERSDFKCSGNQLCNTCEYKMFCGIEN